jgi:anti-sigma-K factor RskA
MSSSDREYECPERMQAAAYVLLALEPDEVDRYGAHLSECAQCRADVANLQTVADSLPTSAPRLRASAELRERVMASVRREAELLRAAGPAADRPEPRRVRRRLRAPQLLGATVAAGLGVAIGLAVFGSGTTHPVTRITSAQLAAGPAGASAVLRQTGAHAELVVHGMNQPPRGKIYEVWLARESGAPTPTNALFGVTSAGGASVNIPGDLASVRRVMVTAEPLGGSAQPTSSPVVVVALRSS